MRKDSDILWKGIIEEVFDDLLRFVFPNADELFDLKRKFLFLDKELATLYREPNEPTDTRLVDKLVQVYRRDGGSEWLLVHLEVQGRAERNFPERMFRYYCRIFDRRKQPVTAVAIFTGADGHRIPDCYVYRFCGTELTYKYNVVRLVDYREAELAANPNPFATVALVAKKALVMGKVSDKDLLRQKLEFAKALLRRKDIPRQKVRAMLTFLKGYLLFESPASNRTFNRKFDQLTNKNKNMGMAEALLEIGMLEVARKLFRKTKLSDAKIAEITGISVWEVGKMRPRRRRKSVKMRSKN